MNDIPRFEDIHISHQDPIKGVEPIFLLLMEGERSEEIYGFVSSLIEMNENEHPFREDCYYEYMRPLNLTFFMLKGKSWFYPLMSFYRTIRENISVIGWSNWEIQAFEKGKFPYKELTEEDFSPTKIPGRGDLVSICEYFNFIQKADDEDVVETTKEMEEELENSSVEIEDEIG